MIPFSRYGSLGVVLLIFGSGHVRHAHAEAVWHPPRLLLWYGPGMSPASGAEDILTAYHVAGRIEDAALQPRIWNEGHWLAKTGGILYRSLRLVLIDDPLLNFYAVVGQHEVFGHGFRAREFGYGELSYEFTPPFPYGSGTGTTYFSYPSLPAQPADRDLAMSMAGVEASQVLGRKLRGNWMRSGSMDMRGSLLYLSSTGDLRNYLTGTEVDETDAGNDMIAYVRTLNGKEGYALKEDYPMGLKRLRDKSLIAFADPFRWYAYWTIFGAHLWSGRSAFAYPSIPLWSVRYLPGFAMGLTPWGPEYHFENLAAWDGRLLTLRLRRGDDTFHPSWGVDVETLEAARFFGFVLDADLHAWKQPRLRLGYGDEGSVRSRLGFGGSLTLLSPPLDETYPLRLAAGQDYKTAGFLPGARLEGGWDWRLGLAWTF